jgi:tripartite-type tricarboxylate transporter receptor subunit TctC
MVARADPDGYTLLMVAGGFTVNPSLYAKLPFDTIKDFERVTMVACAPHVLAVHSSVPANSVKELIALAKAKPRFLNYSSSGIGTSGYMAALRFETLAGIEMVHVPYKGGGDSTAAAVSGQVHLVFITPSAVIQHEKAGRVRILGVTSPSRMPSMPQIPAIAEVLPGYDVQSCYGFLAPARTAPKIIEKLSAEIRGILKRPDIRAQLEGLGFEIIASTPDEYSAFMKDDVTRWQKEFKAAGVVPQ